MLHKLIKKTDKAFYYRIKCEEGESLWINLYSGKKYRLSIPNPIMEKINMEIAEVVNPLYKIEIKDNGYPTTTLWVNVYEKSEEIPGDSAILVDAIIKFSEYTYEKKQGLQKTLVDFVVKPFERDFFKIDTDFFGETPGITETSDEEVNENTGDFSQDMPY